jgi:hypothetical protein
MKTLILSAFSAAVLSTLFLATFAIADAPTGGTEVAYCTVVQSSLDEKLGSVVELYQMSDSSKPWMVAIGQPGSEFLFTPDSVAFDQDSVTLQVAQVIEILIPKGPNQTGKMGTPGAGTDSMLCSANF